MDERLGILFSRIDPLFSKYKRQGSNYGVKAENYLTQHFVGYQHAAAKLNLSIKILDPILFNWQAETIER